MTIAATITADTRGVITVVRATITTLGAAAGRRRAAAAVRADSKEVTDAATAAAVATTIADEARWTFRSDAPERPRCLIPSVRLSCA